MPEPTPADALERMRRQVRAVRWRQNLHELQRALYHLLATFAAAAAALVVLALRSTPGPFVAAAWGIGAVSVLLAAWIARALGRRWLSGPRTPLWIDRHARLEGRLATALELGRCGGARAPFFPLLMEDNLGRLAAWRPERLVPEGMPSGAFAGALAAVGAFLLALLIAPWLQPSAPAAVPSNAPGRIAIARRGGAPAAGRRFVSLRPPDEDDAALARLPEVLQERIRQRLWGEDRQRAREELERAERGASAAREDASPPADPLAQASDRDPEERWAIAPTPPPGARPSAGDESAPPGAAPGADQEAARGDAAREAERDGGAGRHEAAAGAGTGTDPNLLGDASAERAARERFDLPLAARVRALGGGPAPPSADEAPPPAPDARPDLAAAQRRDAPVLKMSVPPAYEAVVRAAFAHRGKEPPP
ncbi:MAG TPA: hypothetical protein VMR79_04350 [Verrucomicrobiae bacterium]|nr:hypothetical protein [Verrucomicrobiae bacterium]